jgi:hypothetical protein
LKILAKKAGILKRHQNKRVFSGMKIYKNFKKIKKLINFDLKNMWKSVKNVKQVIFYELMLIEIENNQEKVKFLCNKIFCGILQGFLFVI